MHETLRRRVGHPYWWDVKCLILFPGKGLGRPIDCDCRPIKARAFYLSLQRELSKWLRAHASELDASGCNDLDTLAPALHHGQLPVIYDSHEYFTEAMRLTGRPHATCHMAGLRAMGDAQAALA